MVEEKYLWLRYKSIENQAKIENLCEATTYKLSDDIDEHWERKIRETGR